MVLRHRILILGVFLFIFAFRNRLVLCEVTNGPVTSSHSTIDTGLPARGDLPDTTPDLTRYSVAPGISYVSATNEGYFGTLDELEELIPTGGVALSHGGQGREGYFSSESRAELPHVLPLRGYTSLSFRTCSYGVFLYQQGENSDSIRLELDENGILLLVASHHQGISSTHTITDLKLNDNRWHHVFLKYELGNLFLGADTQTITIGNETSLNMGGNPLALNLSSTTPVLIIGGGMPGCYLEGAHTQLATIATAYVGIDWDACPLPMGKNCSGYPTDPCFPEPCGKGGVCVPAGENYSCICYTRYSGERCHQDDGPLCLKEENECQNAGVCQEDRLGNATHCACATGYMGHRCETTVRDHCTQNACQNNGTCVINEYGDSFECDCAPGFMGSLCGIEENFCSFGPCLHGGLCTPIPNGFICNCSHTGYRGDVCEVNIDECQELSVFCQEGSTCFDLYGTFECACPPGFGGADCSIDMDECSSSPCRNGGVCADGVNAFFCECQRGFAGSQCEVNIDDCFDGACSPNAICIDRINDFECQCLPGFSGTPPNCKGVDDCGPNPCLNGARCFNASNTFACICPIGFTGLTCETNIDDCEGIYCSNGGTCRDGVLNYTCECSVGFTGPLCDHNIDECAPNPCLHAYNCTDMIGDYACACESGWMGKNCDEGGSECQLVPCLNNGTCVNRNDIHMCVCLPGFEGLNCESNVDDCAENPCENGGSCEDGVANFTCVCPESFMGVRCEEPFDDCASEPCFNGGSCVSTPGQRTHYCECLDGFEGLECENNINDCQTRNVVCSDGTVCFDLINAYECRCPEGYSGSNCSINIDECQEAPCENGGTCHDGIANYTCTCPAGYTGRNCQEDVNECVILSPCVNGICVNNDGSYECYCRPGFSGDNCSLEFDECLYLPCKNGGTCINMINSYQCQCPPGFTGTDCETDIDECESQPCLNGATCVDGIAEFTCECPPGFTDPLCATNIDECESNPCLNDGACTDGINMFECDCADTGFEGLNCEINIDDCLSDPCQHESNCTDLVKNYNCSCYDGYIGQNCEEDVMECASAPCQHDGRCFEFSNTTLYEVGWFDFDFSYATAGGFECQCQPGFEGQLCEVNIDECASDPCVHGACEDGINAYECHCDPGYEDEHCETEIDECQRFDPCAHGTCMDKVADYECLCYTDYGGKNCSVLLEGCQDIECHNNGTCVPLLFNENVHEFRCDCEPGFTGRHCEMATTMSMGGDAHLVLESQEMDGYELSFSFRTTLADVVLAVGQGVDYFTLVLHEGRLKLHSSFLNRYNGIYSGSSLNDGEWQTVTLSMNATHSLLAANNDTTQHDLGPATNISFATTYLGGVTSNLRILVKEPPFTGCFRDVVLNEEEVIPASLTPASKVNVTEGCLRVPQCSPNPCHNEGHCVDLWTSFKCQCKRPYLGVTCRMSFTPATFGNEDFRDSLATVDIPLSDQSTFRKHVDISMLLRTRQSSGLVFYFGKTLESANQLGPETDSDSYLLAELVDGKVVVKVRLGGEEEFFETDHPFISDGAPHLLHVERNEEKVLVNIDERNILNATLLYNGDLMAQILYLGGVPIGNSNRVKRQLGISIINSEGLNKHFKGVLQDIRISNGNETRYVELFPLEIIPNENFSLSGSPLMPTDMHHILSGSVSDDTCRMTPCLQGGTCSVTFNDFHCTCPTGFKGKICDELEYCALHKCPPGGQCQNLIDGYECVADITFDGNTSSLVYQARLYNASPFHTFTTQYRSKVGGIIMAASVQEGSVWVGVAPDVLVVQQVNGSTLTTQFNNDKILDGDWHNITIQFDATGVEVLFDAVPMPNNDQDNSIMVDFDVLVRRGGIQIGSLPDGLNLRSSIRLDVENALEQNSSSGLLSFNQHFRGCMNEARVGGLLLPVYSPEELANNTAVNVFDKVSNMGMSHGCQVCFESECQNGGQCLAPNDTFECSCPAGFQGVLCQVNIDECESSACQNGATCIDGINMYSCDCPPGYEGQFCETEIDECSSNPCQNGGTCFDEIAAFRCNCPEDFMGQACDELKVKNCSKNQCQNGAPCIDIPDPQTGIANNYTCECSEFFTGHNCDVSVDFCAIEHVECDRGTCKLILKDEGWKCECEEGFEGVYCELPTNECLPDPCQNGGTCKDLDLSYTCICPIGWKGLNCTENIDECKEKPGLCNTGECIDVDGSYVCECVLVEYCGDHCTLPSPCYEQSINCTNGDCMNTCNEQNNETQPYCNCFEGWQGEFCDEEVQALTTISIIIGVVVGLMALIAAVGLTIFFMMAKKKRETSGTYSPSKQEFYSPRVEMGNMMKPPPEERLI